MFYKDMNLIEIVKHFKQQLLMFKEILVEQ